MWELRFPLLKCSRRPHHLRTVFRVASFNSWSRRLTLETHNLRLSSSLGKTWKDTFTPLTTSPGRLHRPSWQSLSRRTMIMATHFFLFFSSHTLLRWMVEYSGGETSTLCRPDYSWGLGFAMCLVHQVLPQHGAPGSSPIQVDLLIITPLDGAWLRWSDGNRYVIAAWP